MLTATVNWFTAISACLLCATTLIMGGWLLHAEDRIAWLERDRERLERLGVQCVVELDRVRREIAAEQEERLPPQGVPAAE